MKRGRGFSLVEVLIIVVIILIVASIGQAIRLHPIHVTQPPLHFTHHAVIICLVLFLMTFAFGMGYLLGYYHGTFWHDKPST